MYQNIYRWMSGNFYPFSIGMLLMLLLLEILGKHGKRSRAAKLFWNGAFAAYLLGVLFLTLGLRIRTDRHEQNLKLHWENVILAVQGRGRIPWEDLANIILFLPFGVFFRELFGKGTASYILSNSSNKCDSRFSSNPYGKGAASRILSASPDKCGSRFSPNPYGKGAASCILWGAGLSICIEVLQLLTGCGYCDINDFVCNVLGTAGGYGWGCMMIWAREQVGKFGNPMPYGGVDSDDKREKPQK